MYEMPPGGPEYEPADAAQVFEAPIDSAAAADDVPETDELELAMVSDWNEADDSDGVRTTARYVRSTRETPLLTKEDEQLLGQCVREGVAANRILAAIDPARAPEDRQALRAAWTRDYALKSRTDTTADLPEVPTDSELATAEAAFDALAARPELLRVDAEKGQAAKDALIRANLRLVVSVARRHSGKGLEFDDLVQIGNLGLIEATEHFDYTKGYRFSTGAVWWIRGAMTRAIYGESNLINLTVHAAEQIGKITKAEATFIQTFCRRPNPDELAHETGIGVKRVQEILDIRRRRHLLSLDMPARTDDDTPLGHFIEDTHIVSPEALVLRAVCANAVEGFLRDNLSPHQYEILNLLFGLDGSEPQTVEQLGRSGGPAASYFKARRAKTMRKLRQPDIEAKLREIQALYAEELG